MTRPKAILVVVMFRALRKLLRGFSTTNPTWIKQADQVVRPLSLSQQRLLSAIRASSKSVLRDLDEFPKGRKPQIRIVSADSRKETLKRASMDACVTSPPYCTRIDYTIATLPELSVLYDKDHPIAALRTEMMGTVIVQKKPTHPSSNWGQACLSTLSAVSTHTSKASSTYYHKTMLGYFRDLFVSLKAISYALKSGGMLVVVSQGSYYKDIRIDLPLIIRQMLASVGLRHTRSVRHPNLNSFSSFHPNARGQKSLPEVEQWFKKK